ncbi:hypothetical protein [Peribacillus saganii]|uniref:hypothetical protein n=1 Tax=Peribacillus saganii TaxID=2303992 RepID=UPI001314A789|nr:hypothetical protein [Peribacillus saganii]
MIDKMKLIRVLENRLTEINGLEDISYKNAVLELETVLEDIKNGSLNIQIWED